MSSKEAIRALNAAGLALADVDITGWDDVTLTTHLTDLSAALCELDAQLSRVADAVRSRGYRITEPEPLTPPEPTTQQAAAAA